MKIEEIEAVMRKNEGLSEQYVLPGNYIIVRLDGKGFTKLTKEKLTLEKPFDEKFGKVMIDMARYLFNTGFKVIYGYTQSDEISLLIDRDDQTFSRKIRKLNSVLAGEASAFFSLQFQEICVFDCRTIAIPNQEMLLDYFCWRQEDAHRNSLSAYCYWTLRNNGFPAKQAAGKIEKMSQAEKNELLFQYGINYNTLPLWQKRGVGIYNKEVMKQGFNPVTNEKVDCVRKELFVEKELVLRGEYRAFLSSIFNVYSH
ncbi:MULTISPECIES: tRNA(His) guanylyltransferase Thg1 family protein [Chryseobacterium]|uniref:tRNA(His) guanylyltransferase n=1 Tax=Chryseobacterium camelliae TaxID=1265445 RepID=A0ABU0TE94_9FLAO|nr:MULTISPECIES: tRNA(His) guanylyltransferase Thg1 family protein [Chryseobacterium]MDT3406812.1 tRNA(His) guanylyltransferase [Pseudacidovorax intermedius]MDQ1095393.1 tRNA(His) guanylyltransferase [Chryseobacterium camelliae]MDQ1099333.1 tRNA(His) guanylyltransferase [Chryseobacterium sp. SORGH_AS_1048]MDR6086679.1 tRNA(His) guanylyltransferase [Chryseobacterium sp. SORGH_AS_0909]MDR6131051.1 tRNA(His) guanylyltransferase [Chryseobacterium sp. SORGH_AS_1175]